MFDRLMDMKNNNSVEIPVGHKFLINILIACIFLDGFSVRGVVGFDFYYYYLIFLFAIISCIFIFKSIPSGPIWFKWFLGIFFLINIITSVLFNTFGFLIIKQIAGILFSSFAYWCVFMLSKGNLKFIAKTYVNISYYESVYALVGLVSSMSGFFRFGVYGDAGNFLSLPKIYGSAEEPYFLAVSLIPAVYIHLHNLFSSNKIAAVKCGKLKGIITIMCFFLTGASSGYLAIFLMLAFLAYNKNLLNIRSFAMVVLPFFLALVYFIFTLFSSNSKNFNLRVNDTWYAFFSDDAQSIKAERINGSSFALFSNFKVASNSFKANPISGSGLGTHELNYQRYFYENFSADVIKRFVGELNKQDANSTFLRLLSETGLIGLSFFLYFVFSNLILRKQSVIKEDSMRFLVLFSQGIFVMLIMRLIRTGNYIGNGFFFFFFCYWAIKKVSDQSQNRQILSSTFYNDPIGLPKSNIIIT